MPAEASAKAGNGSDNKISRESHGWTRIRSQILGEDFNFKIRDHPR
jgi:hypothetical protein